MPEMSIIGMVGLFGYIGKRVLITGGHPHSGEAGVIERIGNTPVGQGIVVKLDNGMSCFVFKLKHLKVVGGKHA